MVNRPFAKTFNVILYLINYKHSHQHYCSSHHHYTFTMILNESIKSISDIFTQYSLVLTDLNNDSLIFLYKIVLDI